MSRSDTNTLRHAIRTHLRDHPAQYDSVLLAFLDEHENVTSRQNLFGHLTASAIILDAPRQHVLMIHHAKHKKWLLPGGHIEPGESPLEAARREASEEVGLSHLALLHDGIVTVDIHRIADAPHKAEPEHWHFDLRFLFQASADHVSLDHEEATAYAWRKMSEMGRLGRRLQRIR